VEEKMTKQTTPTLEQRIAAALGNNGSLGSEGFYELINETEAAIAVADENVRLEREKAVDITSSPDVGAAAHVAMDVAELTGDRYRAAVPRLHARLSEALSTEQSERWAARAMRVEAEVDKLATEFSTEYTKHASAIIDLLQRMAASDREVSEINIAVPNGILKRLRTAEQLARGLDAFSTSTPAIAAQVQLTDHLGRVVWPVAKPVLSTIVSLPIIPHPGPNWHEALEAAAAQRREEWEKVIADHERRAKEQKEREEKELVAEDRQDRRNR
jgi:hypothetical protein